MKKCSSANINVKLIGLLVMLISLTSFNKTFSQGLGTDGRIVGKKTEVAVNPNSTTKMPPVYVSGTGIENKRSSAAMSQLKEAITQRLKVNPSVQLDLFVMSQCPFGVMAEQSIAPLLREFGKQVDFRLNFVANETLTNGRSVISSMHGQPEIDENIRQLIVARDNPEKLIDYLLARAANYMSEDWQPAATKAGIDVRAMVLAAKSPEAQELFRANVKNAQIAGINSSPKLLINGEKYTGPLIDPDPSSIATQCQTGADPFTGATWVVCSATPTTAWISSVSGGQYHALYICQSLGYGALGRFGGNCGRVCSYCVSGFSCSNPQPNTTFDNAGTSCGSDQHGPILCNTVQWECITPICVPPAFTNCPGTINASTAPNSCNAVVTYSTPVSGTSPTITYTFSGATPGSGSGNGSGSTFNRGTTTVTVTATNACGTATCTITVNVNDNQPPTITCPPNVVVNTDPGQCYATVNFASTMVLQYDPTGPQVSTTPVPVSFQAPNYNASPLSQVGSNSSWTNTNVWPVGQISSSPTPVPGEYVTFQVTVPSGTDFDRLQYSKLAYRGGGGTFATIRSSLDGFTSDISTVPITPTGFEELVFDLANLPFVSGTVGFRIYFYGSPSATKNDWDDLLGTGVGGNGLRLYVNNLATASDNCGPVSITYSNFPANYRFDKGTTTVTATATDGNNNAVSCNFTVTVNDNELPNIPCPAEITVQCASQVPSPNPAAVLAGTTDNCPGVTVHFAGDVISNQACANRYTITRTYRATDASNNSRTCTQTINVFDNIAPMIACPEPITVQCAAEVPPPAPNSISAGDNCGGPVTVTFVSDEVSNQTCANRFTITRTYRATDGCGNSRTCTQLITVNDDTPPTITCQQTVTVRCRAEVPNPDVESVTANDNCGPVTVVHVGDEIIQQSCENRHIITRTYMATDACGNTATCTQVIRVFDDVPPTIICPQPITVQCAASVPPPAPSTVIANDNCGAVTVVFVGDAISDQTCPNKYTITRTYRATDVCGNSATCTQTITVNDDTPPTITCPPTITVDCTDEVPPPSPNTIVASDNCGVVTVFWADDVISGRTCLNRYTISRIYVALDQCGNSSICTQTIIVNDQTAPTITCPPTLTVQCASQVPTPNPAAITASDNCPGQVTVTWEGDAISDRTCDNRYVITRTYKATDVCGNSATCTQTIRVFDDISPMIQCPQPINVQCAGDVPQPAPNSINAGDNCGGPVTVTWDGDVESNRTCANRFTITRTYKATDACGNSRTCTQIITVNDNTLPTINCPQTLYLKCASQVPQPAPSTIVASDNCGQVTVTWAGDMREAGGCTNRFTIYRTYTATDACGNSASCTQVIMVNDDVPPTITCPPNMTVKCADDVPPPSPSTIVASDNCGVVTVTHVGDAIQQGICANRYFVFRTYRATDACGNVTTCTQTISVFDDVAPVITCPAPVTVQCAGQVPQPSPSTIMASDNCNGTVTVTHVSDVVSNQTCANRFTITRTYMAADACGNQSTCTQVITVFDNTAPTFSCPSNKVIPFTNNCSYAADPANTGVPTDVSDNCGGNVAVTFTDVVSQCGYNTVITRTWTARDICGNSSSCTQTITVTDNTTPYIIYASKEAKFGEDNIIRGDVGVTDANGKAEFKKGCVLDPYDVYAKNITVHMPATVNNKHYMPATGGPNPPFAAYSGGGLSGNHTQTTSGAVPPGNFKDLTIKKGLTVTVNGSNYGRITIEENATVTFTSSSIDIEDLKVKKGKSPGVTRVRFTGCTSIRIKDKVDIEDDCRFNVGGPRVVFYMGDNKKDEEKFTVKADNTQVTANVLMPNGKMKIHGGNGGCIMTGWFVIEKLDSDAKNVIWNMYDCAPAFTSTPPFVNNTEPVVETEVPIVKEKPVAFEVRVYPNPSPSNFSIVIRSAGTEPVTVRVLDMSGKVLSVINNALKGSVINLGSELRAGTYMAEVTQGTNRQLVKMIKTN